MAIPIDCAREAQTKKEIAHRAIDLHTLQTEEIIAFMNRALADAESRVIAGLLDCALGVQPSAPNGYAKKRGRFPAMRSRASADSCTSLRISSGVSSVNLRCVFACEPMVMSGDMDNVHSCASVRRGRLSGSVCADISLGTKTVAGIRYRSSIGSTVVKEDHDTRRRK